MTESGAIKMSVITVCRDSACTIGHTLESFFQQDYPHKELVVIDGASTDETLKIVYSFPQRELVVLSEPDRGIYDAMNKGLRHCGGDAIGFLNSDDCFHDGQVLSELAGALAFCDIVFANVDFVRDHRSKRILRKWQGSEYRKGAFRRGWMAAHPSCYCRRGVADRVGLFDLRYRVAADYDWMLRAFELENYRIRFLNRVVVDMQMGGESTAGVRAYIRGNLEALQARRSHLGVGLVDAALFMKPLGKITQLAAAKARVKNVFRN